MTNRMWFGNCATSIDHKLGEEGVQTIISNSRDFDVVHNLRNRIAAIGIGSTTVLIDNPSLTVKEEYVENEIENPIPIIFDRRGRVNLNSRVFNLDPDRQIIWVRKQKPLMVPDNVHVVISSDSLEIKQIINELLDKLNREGDVMVEGGSTILTRFILQSMLDKLRIFVNSKSLNESNLLLEFPSNVNYHLLSSDHIGNGIENIYKITSK